MVRATITGFNIAGTERGEYQAVVREDGKGIVWFSRPFPTKQQARADAEQEYPGTTWDKDSLSPEDVSPSDHLKARRPSELPCINLDKLFGETYRIRHDDAAATAFERRDPWMMCIPCRCGTIHPFSDKLLCVEIDNHNQIANRVAAIPGVVLYWNPNTPGDKRGHQHGDFERSYLFPVEVFGRVAEIVKPKRKRRLTAEHKAKLATAGSAALARHRQSQ